jgi:hypothetical protein
MSMRDEQIHSVSIAGAIVLTGLLTVGGWWLSRKDKLPDDPLLKMDVIEASLASRTAPQNQPQKHHEAPPPTEKPKGVSHDETVKPPPKKDDKEPATPVTDPSKLSEKFGHADPDEQPTTKPGDFNPNGYGNAAESKGDPWLGKLAADMDYSPPEISRGESAPIGCIRLSPDGKIMDTKFHETTSDDFQTSAEVALDHLKKTRNANPDPVPTHLLKLTNQWLCFKFTVKAL